MNIAFLSIVRPPYVPELDGPTDVSNFDIDDLMEAKTQVKTQA